MHEMLPEGLDTYVCDVTLGEALREQFYLVLDGDREEAIYPVVNKADASARILGPDDDRGDRSWLIDGRQGGSRSSVYRLTFEWGTRRRISWSAIDGPAAPWSVEDCDGQDVTFVHRYYIAGSWSAWSLQVMTPHRDEEGLFEAAFRIRGSRQEEFQILRDKDPRQAIYPATARARDASVPVRGPDDAGEGKHWLVEGRENEEVQVRLRLVGGEAEVTVATASRGERTWRSGVRSCTYHVTGSFLDWALCEMEADPEDPQIFRHHLVIGWAGWEEFQIVVDQDPSQTMYPSISWARCGEATVEGPGPGGEGEHWRIDGDEGDAVEIVLDLKQRDRRRVVQWRTAGRPSAAEY